MTAVSFQKSKINGWDLPIADMKCLFMECLRTCRICSPFMSLLLGQLMAIRSIFTGMLTGRRFTSQYERAERERG